MSEFRSILRVQPYTAAVVIAFVFVIYVLAGCTSSPLLKEIDKIKDWREEFQVAHFQANQANRKTYVQSTARVGIGKIEALYAESAVQLHRIASAKQEICELNTGAPWNEGDEARKLKELIDLTHIKRLQGEASMTVELIYRQRYLSDLGKVAIERQEKTASERLNIRKALVEAISNLRASRDKAIVEFSHVMSDVITSFAEDKGCGINYFRLTERKCSDNLEIVLDNIVHLANPCLLCRNRTRADETLKVKVPRIAAHEGQFRSFVHQESAMQLEFLLEGLRNAAAQSANTLDKVGCGNTTKSAART